MAAEDGGGMAEGFGASPDGRDAPPKSGVAVFRDSLRALELLKDLGSKVSEKLIGLMPNLLTTLRHQDLFVVKQSISSGAALFGAVLEEIALQLHGSGKIEQWLEELWSWMVKFMESVSTILMELGSIGIKVPALKFIETCILYFTPAEDIGVFSTQGKFMRFNVSHLPINNSILNPAALEIEADRALNFLLDVLQSANTFRGSFVIAVINTLATIVKRRPLRYKVILSALIAFNPNFESQKGHASSIRYTLRTAFVGFLRCNHPLFTESRKKINKALRAIIPGESIDQIVRQVERMARTMDRVSHEIRSSKGEPSAIKELQMGNQIRNKISRLPSAALSEVLPAKRIEFEVPLNMAHSTQMTSDLPDDIDDGNGDYSSNTSLVDGDLSAAEKMIAMIGALLAEGERGAESLELLISNIHADLMADIVIETMKHLPKNLTVVSVWHNNAPLNEETPSSSISSQVVPTAAIVSAPTPSLPAESASTAVGTNGVGIFSPDTSPVSNLAVEVRRDPRRDPRRLDPRWPGPVGSLHSTPLNSENSSDAQTVASQLSSKAVPTAETVIVEQSSMPLTSKTEVELSEIPDTQRTGKMQSLEASEVQDNAMAMEQTSDVHTPPNLTCEQAVEEQLAASTPSDATANDDVYNLPESDEFASPDINSMVTEENFHNLIAHPSLLELKDEQRSNLHRLAVTRIIEDYEKIHVTGSSQPCLPLLARLVAHSGADDDILKFLEEHIVLDYPHHKGHELAMHVLYYLQAIVISKVDNCSSVATSYEKFLLGIAKALLDSLPATDKSFNKLLVEAPILPDSSLKLLEDLCHSNYNEHRLEETRDGDRVTQGLVATWGLILGRPSYRQACLDIALECALHPQEEVRAKAIRLVANKLYFLNYASDSIEQFAMQMLLSVVEQQNFEEDVSTQNLNDQQTEDELIGGPRHLEPASSESENNKDNQASVMKVPALSLSQAQQKTSLFFALCLKKPSLLQFVFDIYGKAPKAVKQSIHQHIPVIVKNLSTSYSQLLKIISDPPEGSKILIVLVLETLTEEATPSSELIATVKNLYETKLKDAVILIPMLSSFSKDEVLPIFPRLVDLPLEKFQAALARILQGSAHTGPALTPAEVLIAIHNINPQKDGVALKKITDACTACFEQRIVFTQHVLEKSLNHLVEQVPLPLLFMRTVIQAIDAFPSLVDFVMGILSKLVTKQIWKMPKLWVGFLKCAAQTQPRSFDVLLQLPSLHLESALNRHPNLRTPLAAYANQPNLRTSLPWQSLKVLGVLNETQDDTRPSIPTNLDGSLKENPSALCGD